MHLVTLLALAVCSICGTWQSTFHAPQGAVRRVMEISRREPAGEIVATIQSIDESDVPIVSRALRRADRPYDIGTRHPDRVAGLVYLDAGYWYALNDGSVTPPLGANRQRHSHRARGPLRLRFE